MNAVKAQLARLMAAYPRQEINADTARVYADVLRDVDPGALERACNRLLATSRWFPTIAEIRAEVANERVGHLPAPELAWGEVVSELRRVGHTRPPQFSCPEIGEAVRAVGGWLMLCQSESGDASHRARFIDAYRVCRERVSRLEQLGPRLSGELPSPVKALIGRVAKTLADPVNTGSPRLSAPKDPFHVEPGGDGN